MRYVALLAALSAAACSVSPELESEATFGAQRAGGCPAITETAPGRPSVFFSPFDRPEEQILCALSSAKREVVIAHYNIRREIVLDKLIELKRRGVDVRVAVDLQNSGHAWNVGDDALEAAGIPLVRTKPAGATALMHLKVAVIDGEIAMTGSFNWNETAALANDENVIVFRDPAVVSRYRDQVLEVLGDKRRERQPAQATPEIRVHFTPEEKVDTVIAAEIDRARTSVDVAMFTFTNTTVAGAVERAARRGAAVRVIVERKQAANAPIAAGIERAGGLVVRAGNRIGQYSAMHQKYAIVDGARVLTGATNWTTAGTRTNEEDLVVLDLPSVAAAYRRNFADLLQVYGGIDGGEAVPEAPVLFNPIHAGTAYGDRVVVVGNVAALGHWDPFRGIDAATHADLFPSWSATTRLPAGARVEYKYVTVRPNGSVQWEPGPNRVLEVPASGRAAVTSGDFGDTARSWSPRDAS